VQTSFVSYKLTVFFSDETRNVQVYSDVIFLKQLTGTSAFIRIRIYNKKFNKNLYWKLKLNN